MPDPQIIQKNIVDSALQAGRDGAVKVLTSPLQDAMPFIVLADGEGKQRIEYIGAEYDEPNRKRGTVKLDDEASFMAYWKIHKNPDSSIFATLSPACLTAIFNEHGPDKPAFRDHRAVYTVTQSNELKDWLERDNKPFDSNVAFAEWLENHLPDMLTPPAAKMMQIALNMQVTANASYSNQQRLSDGNTKFAYTNQVEGKASVDSGEITVPDTITISIPIFQGLTAEQYVIEARFRYRLQSGKLRLWYELVRPAKVIEKAFADIVKRVMAGTTETEGTGKAVLFGTP